MASVKMKNVNKIYHGTQASGKAWWEIWKAGMKKREVHVIKDASLEIRDGEFMVLVGPSGCGKSTALRMIAGLEEVSSGEIVIDEKVVNDVSPKDRDIAMVFQNYALYPHMDVYENMAFGLKLRKFPKEEIDKRVQDAAELLGIKHLLKRKPKELSGGQRQRVAMGRAIVRKPKVYLMDEPLSNLDAKLRVQMRAELQKLHQRLGVTTVYVTHDQTEAMTLGSRIVILKDGIVQQINTPLHLYEFPANKFVAGFIGSPSMNFMNGRIVREEGGSLYVEGEGFKIPIPSEKKVQLEAHVGKQVSFGIRPEDIQDRKFAREEHLPYAVKVQVDVSEPMGSEVLLHVKVGDNTLSARVDPHTEAKIGHELDVVFNMNKMHLFDSETEMNLIYPEEA
jgi:multiple sugar transport system ATP-binding protein